MTSWTQVAVDVLTAAGIKRAYATNAVPANPGYPYVVVSTQRVAPGARALAGGHGAMTWRVTTQVFGRGLAEVEDVDGIAFGALQDRRLIDDITCGPCDLQVSADNRDPADDGVLGRTTSYLFVITKEIP